MLIKYFAALTSLVLVSLLVRHHRPHAIALAITSSPFLLSLLSSVVLPSPGHEKMRKNRLRAFDAIQVFVHRERRVMEIYSFPFGTSDAVSEVCVRLFRLLTFLVSIPV
jgi:hypothetical protein